ncbi:LysR family transcriptional regulator [Clostridium sp. C105KSO13]|uniref:LysR family transcriptional regulator n=1 Tax=Clostridium sp. C105KSO13 TaxID=1776045 RepID=UPI00325C0687
MDINYELYKVFYHVASALSFSEASKKLFISQSAVSQSIKTLENKLDQTLFIRSTKRVSLTPEGEILMRHIEPAMHLIQRGEAQLLDALSTGGQIRIGATDTICRYFLIPYLENFHKTFPNAHIKVINQTSIKCVKLLELGQVDLIVVNYPNSYLSNVSFFKKIKTFRDVFIANQSFHDLKDRKLTFEQLVKYPILMLDRQSTTNEFLHRMFQQHQLDLVPEIELTSNDLLMDLARIGLGIAFIPDYCIADNLEDLFIVETEEDLPEREIVIAHNDQIPLTRAAREFLKLFGESETERKAIENLE